MRLTMIGAGYVGLVSGACFADFGHDVDCIDSDPAKIDRLNAGEIPIYEPGLAELVRSNVEHGRLAFSGELGAAVADSDVIFLAVGTPSRRGDGHADLSYVFQAAADLAAHLDGFTVIVTKSTVPVGTGDEVERIIRNARPEADFAVVSNPEFLREGSAIGDFKRPDRIVIGIEDERSRDVMAEVYRPLFLNRAPVHYVNRRTAELIKYASNAFLAVKITYINEMADLCEKVGADVQDVARGMGLDNRIGPKFLHAGPGYGGSCFPKDTLALIKTGQDHESPVRIVETVASINDQRQRAMSRKIIQACGGQVRDKTIALLGLTFKPNTDDMRMAPSLQIIMGLRDAGATVRCYDPEGMEQARLLELDVEYAETAYQCVQGADALAIVTEWNEFRALDMTRVKNLLAAPVVVDLRNIYDPERMAEMGLRYFAIGRAENGAGATRTGRRRSRPLAAATH